MTVLVTGGTGLVGKGIQEIIEQEKVCSEQWVFVGSNDADLTSYDSTSKLFDDVKPTHVLHLAARVGGLYYNSTDNVGFWRDNIAMQACALPPLSVCGATMFKLSVSSSAGQH